MSADPKPEPVKIEATLDTLKKMVRDGNLKQAAEILVDCKDVRLFEALLAGSSIDKKGCLVPGKGLARLGKHTQAVGLLAWAHTPMASDLDATFIKSSVLQIELTLATLEVLAEHVYPYLPILRSEGTLYFDALKKLSDAEAEALSKHDGILYLDGLKKLSDTAAEWLGKHKGGLSLNGLVELSPAATGSLSKHGEYLSLSTELKAQVAKFKSDASVPEAITGVVKVSVAISEDVAGTSGSDDVAIKNDAVEAVAVFETAEANEAKNTSENADDKTSMEKAAPTPAPSAEELEAKLDRLAEMIKGGYLELVAQLISVSTDARLFEALLKGSSIDEEGALKLGEGLQRFAEDAQPVGFLVWAYAPAGAEIDSSFEDKNRPLKWEVQFTVENLEPIVAWRAKHFPHFPQLEIVTVQVDLSLSGLTELSDAAAESLSKHQGELWLNGLTELSDAAAESLSKHEGTLGLNGLRELSDAAAESLSKHEGKLWLEGNAVEKVARFRRKKKA